jgi:hypothetical protein
VSLRSVTPGHCGLVPIAIGPPIRFTASVVTSSAAPLSRASEALRKLLVSFFDLHLRKTASSCAEWSNPPPVCSGLGDDVLVPFPARSPLL